MLRARRFLSFAAIGTLCLIASARGDESHGRHFRDAVWPLLLQRCVSCHGAEQQEGGLRLDSREATLQGGEQGPAIVPGKASESLLIQAVRHAAEELAMPPKEQLSDREIAALESWIDRGATWPEVDAPLAAEGSGERIGNAWEDERNPIVRLFGGERLDLWSLKPIVRPTVPDPQTSGWIRNDVDRFVLSRLEAEGLSPNVEADRQALIRRVTYDLIGLPPAAEEVEAFVADSRIDAYERLVERLLASPRYAEHQARWWLDVVRYSDSNGFDWDEYRPRAWLFRDYVVRSFDADKPFDRFVIEQLAGDELLSGPPKNEEERDALLATAYLRIGPQDNSASLFNEQSRAHHEWMSDLTETTASAFLGLTMSCCRCHDHKFDPLSQADHFRLRAFFEPLKYADDLPTNLAVEQEAIRSHNERLDEQIEALEKERKALQERFIERAKSAKREQLAADERALLEQPADSLNDDEKKRREELEKKIVPSDDERNAVRTDSEKQDEERLVGKVDSLRKQKRSFDFALLATDRRDSPRATHVLYQGDHKSPREEVSPGFVSVLDPNPATIATPAGETQGRRLTLAKWIASDGNPLTARVLVNRVWQQHFGRGLVATPNDFGLAGARPTHPELLDWLASEFVEGGWSIKRLHYLIVTSAAYRRSSAVSPELKRRDPDNELLARQAMRRLTAEQLRDSLLVASGLLNGKADGEPVWPELPSEVLQANPAFLDDNAEKTKGWYASPEEEQNCRSLFLIQKRTVRIPFLETFDLPENAASCARRNVSTVAPQAFSLLNSPLAVKAAKAFASRVELEADEGSEDRVRAAFRLALQREPSADELALSVEFAETHGLPAFCRAMLNLNEFAYVE